VSPPQPQSQSSTQHITAQVHKSLDQHNIIHTAGIHTNKSLQIHQLSQLSTFKLEKEKQQPYLTGVGAAI
jgi:hypothetical protein